MLHFPLDDFIQRIDTLYIQHLRISNNGEAQGKLLQQSCSRILLTVIYARKGVEPYVGEVPTAQACGDAPFHSPLAASSVYCEILPERCTMEATTTEDLLYRCSQGYVHLGWRYRCRFKGRSLQPCRCDERSRRQHSQWDTRLQVRVEGRRGVHGR